MPRYVQAFRYQESSDEIKGIVIDLYTKLIEYEKQFVPEVVFEKFDTDKEMPIITESLEMVFILLEDGKPIGMLGSDSVIDGEISMLYIEPEYRRSGAASRLILAFKDRVPNEMTVFCISTNAAAMSFYKKEGFTFEAKGMGNVKRGTHPNR